MIVVLGRPGLDERGRVERLTGFIALAAARAGGRVELVGSVGDDPAGEDVALALGSAGVGHAALLRDPARQTPGGSPSQQNGDAPALPRLDAADADLGLHYLMDCRVLVVAEPIDVAALEVAVGAARYHSAALIMVGEPVADIDLPEDATLLQAPEDPDGIQAFAELVGRYAAALDTGMAPQVAWQGAVEQSGWTSGPA